MMTALLALVLLNPQVRRAMHPRTQAATDA
jgi:hypothetical protein